MKGPIRLLGKTMIMAAAVLLSSCGFIHQTKYHQDPPPATSSTSPQKDDLALKVSFTEAGYNQSSFGIPLLFDVNATPPDSITIRVESKRRIDRNCRLTRLELVTEEGEVHDLLKGASPSLHLWSNEAGRSERIPEHLRGCKRVTVNAEVRNYGKLTKVTRTFVRTSDNDFHFINPIEVLLMPIKLHAW